jgi:hypothetical protein
MGTREDPTQNDPAGRTTYLADQFCSFSSILKYSARSTKVLRISFGQKKGEIKGD